MPLRNRLNKIDPVFVKHDGCFVSHCDQEAVKSHHILLPLINPEWLPVDMQFRELMAKRKYTMVIFIVKPRENGLAGCTSSIDLPEGTAVSSYQISLTNMCFLPTIY